MTRTPLALDTPPNVERMQIERWRQMSPADKAALVTALTQTAFELALAGVRSRHPEATPREHAVRLAILVLGIDLAREAYPEAVALLQHSS